MLADIRKFSKTKVFQALLMVLVVSFAVWGIGDIFRGGQRVEVARVGDVVITDNAFGERFREQIGRLRAAVGGRLDLEQAVTLGVPDQVLESMIQGTLFDVETVRLGLDAGMGQVVQWIRRNPNFQNAVGEFDRRVFERMLQANGMSEEDFVALLSVDFRREQLNDALSGAAETPDVLADFLYGYREERRVADVAHVRASSVQGIEEPDEASLRTFHQERADLFMAPEYRSLTAVFLRPEDIAAEISIAEDDVRQEYDLRRDEFTVPERRTVEQIVVSDESQRDQVSDLLLEGRAFADVARQVTGAAPIEIGTVTRQGLPVPALGDAAFALAEGNVSDPVESDFGWHFLRVTAIEPGGEASFEEVRESLRNDLALDRATDDLVALANGMEDELAGGASLEEAARTLDLEPVAVAAVDRRGRDRAETPIAGLPADPRFLEAVFGAEEGLTSPLTDTTDGGYFVLRVDGIMPTSLRPFEEVRGQVTDAWRADQQRKRAEEVARQVADQVSSGTPLADVAAQMGLETGRTQPLTRADHARVAGGAPQLTDELFEIDLGGVATAEAEDGYVVAQLAEIQPAAQSGEPEARDRIGSSLAAEFDRDLLDAYVRSLRQEHGVEINREVLNRLIGEGV